MSASASALSTALWASAAAPLANNFRPNPILCFLNLTQVSPLSQPSCALDYSFAASSTFYFALFVVLSALSLFDAHVTMAYNSWDKLAKAQRDYPKPKFANQVVDKALKKQSNNPYLLVSFVCEDWIDLLKFGQTWKADILLQLNHDRPKETLAFVERAHQQPIMDTELLVYMYETLIAASRLENEDHHISTIGAEAFATWQATASRMKHKSERVSLWDLLFSTAIQEDCWEDVRLVSCLNTALTLAMC